MTETDKWWAGERMIQNTLPSVLQQPYGNSLSMERALKQIKGILIDPASWSKDSINASIDDVEIMLAVIVK